MNQGLQQVDEIVGCHASSMLNALKRRKSGVFVKKIRGYRCLPSKTNAATFTRSRTWRFQTSTTTRTKKKRAHSHLTSKNASLVPGTKWPLVLNRPREKSTLWATSFCITKKTLLYEKRESCVRKTLWLVVDIMSRKFFANWPFLAIMQKQNLPTLE